MDVEDRFLSLQDQFLYLIEIHHISIFASLCTLFTLISLSDLAHSPLIARLNNCWSFLLVLDQPDPKMDFTKVQTLSKLSRLGISASVDEWKVLCLWQLDIYNLCSVLDPLSRILIYTTAAQQLFLYLCRCCVVFFLFFFLWTKLDLGEVYYIFLVASPISVIPPCSIFPFMPAFCGNNINHRPSIATRC